MPDQLENDETQEAYWELQKFIILAHKANPNVLECLYTPIVEMATPLAQKLLDMKTIFLSRMVHQTYNGYVMSQFKKMQTDIRNHAHHYLSFAATQWKLFHKENPPRVKPLLYVYRVLLTGIHLMKTGEVEANLGRLNESAMLSFIDELIERKLSGPEKSQLPQADLAFHEAEYNRLVAELEAASAESKLLELPAGKDALNDLLVRLRLNGVT